MVWHLLQSAIALITAESAMELNSFEFGLCLFLSICSRTIMIDRYGIFIALEEMSMNWVVMSKFYYWNENDFCISTAVCNLHEVFHKVPNK